MLNDIMQWIGWIGGAGLIGWAILAMFAPGAIQVVSAWLTALAPLVKGAAEGIVWFFKTMWEGFKDVVDNSATILFVFVVAGMSMLYIKYLTPSQRVSLKDTTCNPRTCEQCINDLRKDYKFVKRTPPEKKAYLKKNPEPVKYKWWWEDLFSK
jgi:mannose/fructose/N-acetylgalactosamine-specific phosphotransferase system component IID